MWIKRSLILIVPVMAIAVTIIAIDSLAYWLIPNGWVGFAPDYRKEIPLIVQSQQSKPYQARGYPRGYFREDKQFGFDIQPNISVALHIFRDASFEIFSNDLGCFDRNNLGTIQNSKSFYYFAGDSYAWGYAAYEKKYPTVYETRTGRVSVKCGVTHTGQIHQYEKFQRIIKLIGKYPKTVFVGYCVNDPSNDFAHPHTTVIDGFQVDTVEITDGLLTQRNITEVKNAIRVWIESHNSQTNTATKSLLTDGKEFLMTHSLVANLVAFGKNEIKALLKQTQSSPQRLDKSIYKLDESFNYRDGYQTNKITLRNRQAITRWADDSKSNSYQLVFLLIPPRDHFNDVTYFSDLKIFLAKQQIRFYDLTLPFKESGKSSNSLYWPIDEHLNNEGNEFVGELLAKQF